MALMRDPPKSAFAVALAFATVWLFPVDGTDHSNAAQLFRCSQDLRKRRWTFPHPEKRINDPRRGKDRNRGRRGGCGRPRPITYYHDKSAMNRVIEAVRARKGGPFARRSSDLVPGHLRAELRRTKPGASSRLTQRSLTSRATLSISPFCRPVRRACSDCAWRRASDFRSGAGPRL